jgi:hypothetical protein
MELWMLENFNRINSVKKLKGLILVGLGFMLSPLSWCEERNRKETWIDWRFTTEDARIKLKRLYPSLIN